MFGREKPVAGSISDYVAAARIFLIYYSKAHQPGHRAFRGAVDMTAQASLMPIAISFECLILSMPGLDITRARLLCACCHDGFHASDNAFACAHSKFTHKFIIFRISKYIHFRRLLISRRSLVYHARRAVPALRKGMTAYRTTLCDKD